jgi:hypothetical protein
VQEIFRTFFLRPSRWTSTINTIQPEGRKSKVRKKAYLISCSVSRRRSPISRPRLSPAAATDWARVFADQEVQRRADPEVQRS